jgi:hypothetical protein
MSPQARSPGSPSESPAGVGRGHSRRRWRRGRRRPSPACRPLSAMLDLLLSTDSPTADHLASSLPDGHHAADHRPFGDWPGLGIGVGRHLHIRRSRRLVGIRARCNPFEQSSPGCENRDSPGRGPKLRGTQWSPSSGQVAGRPGFDVEVSSKWDTNRSRAGAFSRLNSR